MNFGVFSIFIPISCIYCKNKILKWYANKRRLSKFMLQSIGGYHLIENCFLIFIISPRPKFKGGENNFRSTLCLLA